MHLVGQKQAWRPMARTRLGIDWGGLLTDVVGGGLDVWSSYQQQEAAEEARRAAETAAAAAAAARQAEAERAAAERATAERIAAEAEAGTDEVFGIKKDYLIYGGLGLAAIAVAIVALR